jgi:tetratricopeptide (TPR) repeat protein
VHYYTLAVDADPTYAPALVNLAAAYLDLGERDLALGHVNRALREEPGLASAHNNRALAWLQVKDYAQAERDLLAAARLEPRHREVAQNLARLYEVQGKGDEARRWTARVPPTAEREGPADGLAGLAPGMPLGRFTDFVGTAGVREVRVPVGGGPGRDLALQVASRHGLAVVARGSVVEAVALLPGARASTAQGLRPGDSAAKVEAAWGRAPGRDGIQGLHLWGYPGRGAAVLVADDRVQAIWLGAPGRREP